MLVNSTNCASSLGSYRIFPREKDQVFELLSKQTRCYQQNDEVFRKQKDAYLARLKPKAKEDGVPETEQK